VHVGIAQRFAACGCHLFGRDIDTGRQAKYQRQKKFSHNSPH
jgi:hypothetical protein